MNIQKLIFNLNDIYYTNVGMKVTCMITWSLIKHKCRDTRNVTGAVICVFCLPMVRGKAEADLG